MNFYHKIYLVLYLYKIYRSIHLSKKENEMFGMRDYGDSDCRWAVGRHGRGHHGRRSGWGGRHGRGDGDDTVRAGRMWAKATCG